jgi:hypothetical protein
MSEQETLLYPEVMMMMMTVKIRLISDEEKGLVCKWENNQRDVIKMQQVFMIRHVPRTGQNYILL